MMNWSNVKSYCGVTVAAVVSGLNYWLGGWDMWLQAIVMFAVADYIAGILAAAFEKKLDSKIGYKGIIKKMFMFLLIAVAFQIDLLFKTNIVRVAVIGFYLGIEGLSIVENAGRCGVWVPKTLKNALVQLKNKGNGEEVEAEK